jgi:SMI1 / KNR4 family (SUKH-1)
LNVANQLANHSGIWRPATPANDQDIRRLVAAAPLPLPEAYLALLRISDGGEGELPVQPYWSSLWPARDVLQFNADYEVPKYAAGLLAFGTSGGGELLALDLRQGPPHSIVSVPCIGMSLDHALVVAPEFESFIRILGCQPAG